jgi:hypothetical protein
MLFVIRIAILSLIIPWDETWGVKCHRNAQSFTKTDSGQKKTKQCPLSVELARTWKVSRISPNTIVISHRRKFRA